MFSRAVGVCGSVIPHGRLPFYAPPMMRSNQNMLFSLSSSLQMPLTDVPDVDIDPKGRFKYILIHVLEKATKEEKYIVRGYKHCPYHADIFDETRGKTSQEFKMNCPGGGRIEHDPEAKKLFVYGHSVGFGKPDHRISVEVLKKKYPDYEITWSDDGY